LEPLKSTTRVNDEVQLARLEGATKAPERGALALEMLVVHLES